MRKTVVVCILAVLTICGTLGKKLTKSENEQIQQICGSGLKQQKVMHGVKAEVSDAPWAVPINVLRTDGAMHCSGTLISPRHVITARHCFLNDFEDGAYTYVYDGLKMDKSNCVKNDYLMPRGKEKAEVHFSTKCRSEKACEDVNLDRNLITRYSVKVLLPGVCAHESSDLFDHDDFAIVELDKDVLFSEKILPACIPENKEGLTPGTSLTTFGFGFDPADKEVSTGVLRFETVTVKKCDRNEYICTMSLDGTQLACRGDSGAGSVLQVGKRTTVIAVLSRGEECRTNMKWNADYMAPVIKYKEKICEFTGICQM